MTKTVYGWPLQTPRVLGSLRIPIVGGSTGRTPTVPGRFPGAEPGELGASTTGLSHCGMQRVIVITSITDTVITIVSGLNTMQRIANWAFKESQTPQGHPEPCLPMARAAGSSKARQKLRELPDAWRLRRFAVPPFASLATAAILAIGSSAWSGPWAPEPIDVMECPPKGTLRLEPCRKPSIDWLRNYLQKCQNDINCCRAQQFGQVAQWQSL